MTRWWTAVSSGAVTLALTLTMVSVTWAQPNNANINANANVLRPVTVTAQNDLDFGDVFPGVNKSIAITDGTAGRWHVAGATSAEVTLSFALPTDLSDGGGNTLTIAFAAGDAGYNTANDASAATGFDPSAGATTTLSGGTPGELYTWVGGTVQPTVDQTAGAYTGTITLTVDYTGN